MGRYFGTDGIRGKAYAFLTEELGFRVGRSLSLLGSDLLIIAMDTRESGPPLKEAIKNGARTSGIDTMDIGIVPTPLLCYLSRKFNAIGVMITASHNPYHDNGIKVFLRGKKIPHEDESVIENCLDGIITPLLPELRGKEVKGVPALPLYLELFTSFIQKTNLKIALDLANGATVVTASSVFKQMAEELYVTGDNPDGKNINLNVGSTYPDSIIGLVKKSGSDVGFAFDGDGDRVIAVDHLGNLFDGDLMIYVIACYLHDLGKLSHNVVVLTKMSNLGIIKALNRRGIEVIAADVGDKYVLEMMDSGDYVLGGENSGHIINKALLDTGDGVLNAAFITSILAKTGKSLQELTVDVKMYPNKLLNLTGVNKDLAKHPDVLAMVNIIKNELKSDGAILVRPSGTEPMIRINVTAPTKAECDDAIERIVNTINALKQ